MFLCEHRLEVSQICAGISLFKVDVPLSSKGIGFGTEMSGMESDDEVELTEEFRPLDLAAGE